MIYPDLPQIHALLFSFTLVLTVYLHWRGITLLRLDILHPNSFKAAQACPTVDDPARAAGLVGLVKLK